MNLQRTVPPESAPVTLATFKEHLRIRHDDQDALLATYLSAAASELDGPAGTLGRCIMTQTWVLRLALFGGPIALPITPLQSLTVEYVDTVGDTQTLPETAYTLRLPFRGRPIVEWDATVLPGLSQTEDFPVILTMVGGADASDPALSQLVMMRAADFLRTPEAAGAQRYINPSYEGLLVSNRLVL
ncbi:head-tail connector protein [Pararhodobacter zhoushanensis]|uniref:head-tail connector protein n=1 Tax=Pararhodobacter zhoushanensis TaxID=2479545 RepID=UPI000F8F17C2|nr:phage head-tail connector protein [Pararhodobacter zhoushanensis]